VADPAPEIKVRLTAEDAGVAAAIKELGLQLKNLKTQQDETASSGLNLSRAFNLIAASAALIRLEQIGKAAFDSTVNIGNMAAKTGIGTEALSVFHFAAQQAGVSTEVVDKALLRAARSITLFEQGSKAAAAGFIILGIKQKDFAGLNTDQKIALVAEKLGGMKEGLAKTTAALEIFSRSGAELIPVVNRIAAEGFGVLAEKLRSMGLLLTQQMVDSARVAKASLQELDAVVLGLTTQFEAGLLPSIVDVTQALVGSATKSGDATNAFLVLGRAVGEIFKGTVVGFEIIGSGFEQIGSDVILIASLIQSAFENIGRTAFAAADVMRLHFRDAFNEMKGGLKSFQSDFKTFWDANGKLLSDNKQFISGVFPSAADEKKRMDALLKNLRPDKTTDNELPQLGEDKKEKVDPAVTANIKAQEERDALAKDHAAQLHAQLQGELDIWKAFEKQREEAEKDSYDKGKLSTDQYYARRQADLKQETASELAILRQELFAARSEAATASAEQTKNEASAKSAQAKDFAKGEVDQLGNRLVATPDLDKAKQQGTVTPNAAAFQAEADRNSQVRSSALVKIDELETKIATTTIESDTKSMSLTREEEKTKETEQQKELEFQKEIAQLQGKTVEVARAEIEAEAQKRTLEAQQSGGSQEDVTRRLTEIEQWKQLKLGVAEFDAAEKKESDDQKKFEIEKSGIEIQARAGLISQGDAQRQINNLTKQHLPLLLQEAQAELKVAQANNNPEEIVKAQETIKALQNIGITVDTLGKKVKTALGSDFQTFFNSLTSGTVTASKAFQQLGIDIIKSLEQIAEQMVIAAAEKKLLDALGLAGDLTKKVTTITTNDLLITSEAGVAGAAGFASAMLGLPFPANVAAAPGVMAAAITATESNMALGSAAQGAFLNQDMLVQAHADELILPKDISTGLVGAINTGSFEPPSELLNSPLIQNFGGNVSNNHHFHGDVNNHGSDSHQMTEDSFVKMYKTAARRGRV
jgi:hypothetical protein